MTRKRRVIDLDPNDGSGLAWLYEHGNVESAEREEDCLRVAVRLTDTDHARFLNRLVY